MRNTIKIIRHGQGASTPLDVFVDGVFLDPAESLKVFNHSPDGFEAGYYGPGPEQLALAILMTVAKSRTAVRWHQSFKTEFTADPKLQDEGTHEYEVDLKAWIKRKYTRFHTPINRRIIKESGLDFTLNKDETIAKFRNEGKPKVDFYFSSGRWRVVGGPTVQRSYPGQDANLHKGAVSFLEWYEYQTTAELNSQG